MAEAYRTTMEELEAAARALCEKLRIVDPAISGAFAFMAVHSMEYDGPNYSEELKALEAILETWKN